MLADYSCPCRVCSAGKRCSVEGRKETAPGSRRRRTARERTGRLLRRAASTSSQCEYSTCLLSMVFRTDYSNSRAWVKNEGPLGPKIQAGEAPVLDSLLRAAQYLIASLLVHFYHLLLQSPRGNDVRASHVWDLRGALPTYSPRGAQSVRQP